MKNDFRLAVNLRYPNDKTLDKRFVPLFSFMAGWDTLLFPSISIARWISLTL